MKEITKYQCEICTGIYDAIPKHLRFIKGGILPDTLSEDLVDPAL